MTRQQAFLRHHRTRHARPLPRRHRRIITLTALGLSVGLACGGLGTAAAMWQDTDTFTPRPIGVGGLSFQASEVTPGTVPQVSSGGTVTVTLPGSVIAADLNGPVIWQFAVTGAADGIAGLDYTIEYSNPEPAVPDRIDTVLQASTMRVYLAASGGDCSTVPNEVPVPDENGLVTLPGAPNRPAGHYTLQAAGDYLGQGAAPSTTQLWCVALAFKSKPDGAHANIATATAKAANGDDATAFSVFKASIQFPNLLSPLGVHVDTALAEAMATSGTMARAQDVWRVTVFPDPANEPDLPIIITPRVTTLATPAP